MKKIIHVNRQAIAQNRKDDGGRPTITVKTYKENIRCQYVEIEGPAIILDADLNGMKPLACGARVWIETRGRVRADKGRWI